MNLRAMSKLLRIGLLAVLCLSFFAGCGTARLQVPEGREVRLLDEDEYASVRESRRVWFWLWGNSAISDDSTIPEIEKHNLKEVRMTSKQTLLDTVINVLGGVVSIVCRTIVVEGNP
jgi:hypothetical protein